MRHQIFELFAGVIARLPPEAVLKAIDLECNMLENDAKERRLPVPEDASSIFYFREFVRAVQLGQLMRKVTSLPPDHIEFLKETIVRLIQVNELPPGAMNQFDCVFMPDVDS